MIKQIRGKKVQDFPDFKISKNFEKVVVDLGCGDGKKLYNLAKDKPSNFYIGIDSNAEALEDISFKTLRKPSKGGLANIIYLESAVENLPKELFGLADEIQINFPWGSLLSGIVNVEAKIIENIKAIANKNAELIIFLTYGDKFEGKYMEERALPEIDKPEVRDQITTKLQDENIEVLSFEKLTETEKQNLDSTWAKKILSERNRDVYKISAIITNIKNDPESITQDAERQSYTFHAYGHPSIKAVHFKTLEFTKEDFLTERGDCIVGIRSDYDLKELKKFNKKVKFILSVIDPKTNKEITSEFKCTVNPIFKSEHELVLRKSFFQSDRTFGHNLNRGANWVDRRMVEIMQNPKTEMKVTVVEGWK